MIRGMIAGKFMPLHDGHLDLIHAALLECDHLDIIHSFSDSAIQRCSGEIGHGFQFSPVQIQRWLQKAVAMMDMTSRVTIYPLDETHFPAYPEGVEVWGDAVLKLIGDQPNKIFTGDACYRDTYRVKFPLSEVLVLDRGAQALSATIIRSNFSHLKHCVPSYVRQDILDYDRQQILQQISTLSLTLRELEQAIRADWASEYLTAVSNRIEAEYDSLKKGVDGYR